MASLYGRGAQCWWVIPTNCPEGTGQFQLDHQFDLTGKVLVLSEFFIVEVMKGYQMTSLCHALWAPTFQLEHLISTRDSQVALSTKIIQVMLL